MQYYYIISRYLLCYAHCFGGVSGRIIFAHVDICAGQCCGAVVVRVPKIFPVFSGGGQTQCDKLYVRLWDDGSFLGHLCKIPSPVNFRGAVVILKGNGFEFSIFTEPLTRIVVIIHKLWHKCTKSVF